MSDTLRHAQDYIARGWKVLPLKTKEKAPAIAKGFKGASGDLETLKQWFSDSRKNIGIATGALSGGLAVVDVDPKNGGLESLQVLKSEYNFDTETRTVRTGSDGFHFYFYTDRPTKSHTGILPGIDIKADGGYVVAPPSIHPNGAEYRLEGSLAQLKEYPHSLIEMLLMKREKKKSGKLRSSNSRVAEGGRHNYLVSEMGKLRDGEHAPYDVDRLLNIKNKLMCKPPLPQSEVTAIAASFAPRTNNETLAFAPYTDLGNAERLRAFHGENLIFVEQMAKWHVYDGSRYLCSESGNAIVKMTKQMLRKTGSELGDCRNDKGDSLQEHLRKSESLPKINALVKLAQSELSASTAELDVDPFLLNVLNGTLDLRTGKLHSHKREDKITKLVSIEFDPNSEHPQWSKLINDVTLNSPELSRYLQKLVGYCLTGVATEQAFWILAGNGSNGKTTFLDVVKKLAGEYGRTSDVATFTVKKSESVRNDLARLFDARLVTCAEISAGKSLDEAVIKLVTGGDPITARFLYRELFEYLPKWKLLMAVNHLPHIEGTDHGMWRRVKCIPFNATFSGDQIDRDLPKKLERELSGILNWALEGCLLWQKEGLSEPIEVKTLGDDFRQYEDSLEVFLEEVVEKGPEYSVSSTELFREFAAYQKAHGQFVDSHKKFGTMIRTKGYMSGRDGTGRIRFFGMRMKSFGSKLLND